MPGFTWRSSQATAGSRSWRPRYGRPGYGDPGASAVERISPAVGIATTVSQRSTVQTATRCESMSLSFCEDC